MSGEAFGVRFGFDDNDALNLSALVLDGDSRAIAEWLEAHIKTHRDMHALHEFIGRAIYKVWPMALTKDADLAPADFWALEAKPGAKPVGVFVGQIITASLNGDWDTLTALIKAMLQHPEEFHGRVTAHLLAAFGDGLRAVTNQVNRSEGGI